MWECNGGVYWGSVEEHDEVKRSVPGMQMQTQRTSTHKNKNKL